MRIRRHRRLLGTPDRKRERKCEGARDKQKESEIHNGRVKQPELCLSSRIEARVVVVVEGKWKDGRGLFPS